MNEVSLEVETQTIAPLPYPQGVGTSWIKLVLWTQNLIDLDIKWHSRWDHTRSSVLCSGIAIPEWASSHFSFCCNVGCAVL